jgi:hypothetical protein
MYGHSQVVNAIAMRVGQLEPPAMDGFSSALVADHLS